MNNVFLFDPTCEMAIANSSPYYHPPQNIVHFSEQLSWLPILLADEADYIISKNEYNDRLASIFEKLGRKLPEIVDSGIDYSFNRFVPWGWSPMIHHRYKNIKKMCGDSFHRMPNSEWSSTVQKYYERAFALDVCKGLIDCKLSSIQLLPKTDLPQVVQDMAELEKVLMDKRKIMAKLPLSSSGRGVLKVDVNNFTENERGRVRRMIEMQTYVTVEKYLDISTEFGMLFSYFSDEGLRFHGFSFTQTQNGRYNGNLVNQIPKNISQELLDEIRQKLVPNIGKVLDESGLFNNYNGYFGVDACVYKEQGELKLNPCMEINLRMTMGHIALAAADLLVRESRAEFKIYSGENFEYFCRQMRNTKPLLMIDEKIVSGFVSLSPESENARTGAYLQVYNG